MKLIGLTGGIASGKSLVAARLRELGAVHVDADQLARQVVEPGTPALDAVVRAFGDGILNEDGSLNRAALGALVFADPEKRARLNGIVHPAVGARSRELFAAAAEADPDAVVVYDVPLLVEAGRDRDTSFDAIVVVHADAETRVRRMMEHRGMGRQEALARIAAQATDEERLAIADVVIDNSGSIDHTIAQVDALWESLSAGGPVTSTP